jgi:hypothetical protein
MIRQVHELTLNSGRLLWDGAKLIHKLRLFISVKRQLKRKLNKPDLVDNSLGLAEDPLKDSFVAQIQGAFPVPVAGLVVRCYSQMLALEDEAELPMELKKPVDQLQMELTVDYGCEEVHLV